MNRKTRTTANYVQDHLRMVGGVRDPDAKTIASARLEKTLLALPEEVLDLFLSGGRSLNVIVMPDVQFPVGMSTKTDGPAHKRKYTIFLYSEHTHWPEDHFIGALLHELGHVVAQRPPESEWPVSRAERARFKEMLESRADAMVWRWGLRHYNICYLCATYPEHWVHRIINNITKVLLEEGDNQYY